MQTHETLMSAALDAADWSTIPGHLHPGLVRYFRQGVPTGSFLRACLEGDRDAAWRQADDFNRPRLDAIFDWIALNAPIGSYGSADTCRKWIAAGGLEGKGEVNATA